MLLLAVCLACFHLGNGAMLPLYGMAVVSSRHADAAMFTAETVMVAQGVMIVAAFVATRMARRTGGYWLALLVSFAVLPLRGVIAGHLITHWGVWPVQMLDGIAAGLQSVAVPGLVARLLDGTGRVNVGQGAVITVQNVGASLSPALGGWLAQMLGYPRAFMLLGGFALISVALWAGGASVLRRQGGRRARGRALA